MQTRGDQTGYGVTARCPNTTGGVQRDQQVERCASVTAVAVGAQKHSPLAKADLMSGSMSISLRQENKRNRGTSGLMCWTS